MINQQIKKNLNEQIKLFKNNKPFKHIEINNFLEPEFLDKLIKQIEQIKFNFLNTDLYQFYQSSNLSELDKFQRLFINLQNVENLKYFSELTGHKLSKIDLSVTKYQKTGYLLPHDDRLECRKIAYMLYLNTLNEEDGGELALFDSKKNQPSEIIKKIRPVKNKLFLFEVSNNSFHEVKEVLSDSNRFAISGWFY